MPDTRVLVIADNLLARLGMSTLLDSIEEVVVVGQIAGDDEDSLADTFDIYNPDIIVYDLGYDPLALLKRLQIIAESDIPVLTLLPDNDYANHTVAVLQNADAYGVLMRDSDAHSLQVAIQAIMQGLVILEPSIAQASLPHESLPLEPLVEQLTPRESEVLQLLAQGMTNKAIAHALDISPNTVKFHINALLSKLNAQSRTEAVVNASRHGLIIL